MAVYRFTFGGVLVESQRWSIGISATIQGTGPVTPTPAQMTTIANQAFDDFVTAAWSTAASGTKKMSDLVCNGGNFDQVRAYYYGGQSTAQVVGVSSRNSVPGTTNISHPPQIAVVASLLTGAAGRTNRGRIYIPGLGLGLSPSGRIITGGSLPIATMIANWLTLFGSRSIGSNVLIPVVASATSSGRPITAVQVDNIADTQRRRRDKLVASERPTVAIVAP